VLPLKGAKLSKSAESREESKYVRELRKQLIKVKKENANIRKRNHYLEGLMIDVEDAALQEEEKKFIKLKQSDRENSLICPQCSSNNVVGFELRSQQYYNCSDCGSKGKKIT